MFLAFFHCCDYPEISEDAKKELAELEIDVEFFHAGLLGDLRGSTITPFVKIEGSISIGKRDAFARCLAKGFCSSKGFLSKLKICFSSDNTVYFCEDGKVVRISFHEQH